MKVKITRENANSLFLLLLLLFFFFFVFKQDHPRRDKCPPGILYLPHLHL